MRFAVILVCLALPAAACLFFASACESGAFRKRAPIVVPPTAVASQARARSATSSASAWKPAGRRIARLAST